ncbi:ABC transporter ATP-binding protein [Dactylosporangium matsuzakiense]|uniref:ABC transporter ATP-binding protein n=1 Tax=Dactylosporangium matsuzakiense TaxID=53360 RepID=A0A9W6KLJ3_9ACTN|nr:ABC transporter ATP-binding protein [Dactylosporangium matsuzakiense]UWZ46868.1 ABC transporter ATP-binding protein [Dactylosporangium matsuzakiense]GLL04246.1 ABC transporter ATP-binding protein [Dactylosporangium matsuzakiense]
MTLIETRALTKRYGGGVTALSELTLAVEPGIIGLVGANGAGKSTFIKIMLGLLPPSDGELRVLGLDPTTHAEQVRSRVGYMPEHDCLPGEVSAAEFVTHLARMSGLPATAARERASEALRHVGLYEERYRQIGGYSTGMKQRVKLAQALAHDPDLLLLDEPTNGLDPAGRDAMLELVHRIGTEFGISIVVCSHLLGEVERICNSIIAIDGGRLLRSATVEDMTTSRDVLMVEVSEGVDQLTARLAELGIPASRDGAALNVPLDSEDMYDRILVAVAELDLPLHRLDQRRHRVAELFQTHSVTAPALSAQEAGRGAAD